MFWGSKRLYLLGNATTFNGFLGRFAIMNVVFACRGTEAVAATSVASVAGSVGCSAEYLRRRLRVCGGSCSVRGWWVYVRAVDRINGRGVRANFYTQMK